MSYEYTLPPIRCILDYPGFVEGWATYVEMMSYSYAGLDEEAADMLSCNQSAMLSLYATSDIGIHYYGWGREEMYDFWCYYGICDHEAVDEITRLILAEPGNYLKYYVGYLEFLALRDDVQDTLGADFDLKEFHKTILDIGPAPFDVVREYWGEYYPD